MLIFRSTRICLDASVFNKHIICLITHIAAVLLFTLCLKWPTAAPAPLYRKAQSALIGQITRSVVIGQPLTSLTY